MNRIRELRKLNKMTMKELGRTIGLSESTISLYETEKHQPDHATLNKLADVFGVSIDYLLGREEKENRPIPEKELDDLLVNMISDLSEDEMQRVRDFVSGLKASRKV